MNRSINNIALSAYMYMYSWSTYSQTFPPSALSDQIETCVIFPSTVSTAQNLLLWIHLCSLTQTMRQPNWNIKSSNKAHMQTDLPWSRFMSTSWWFVVYFSALSVSRLHRVEWYYGWWMMHCGGFGKLRQGLTDVLSWHLLGGSEKNGEKPQSG